MTGKFICIEGLDGAGKSQQLSLLVQRLQDRLDDTVVVQTREPGGTPIGLKLRALLLDIGANDNEPITTNTEMLLMFAAREQHLANLIVPALEQGDWVITDRFVDSNYAYQVRARDGDNALFMMLESRIVGDHYPDLTLTLDVTPEISKQRLGGRTDKSDRLDQEMAEFRHLIRQGFQERQYLPNHHWIDASGSIEEVHELIWTVVTKELLS